MSFPSRDLSLLALAVRQDMPVDPAQPTRVSDGIHLRWSFSKDRGFPWFGYYLFRRRSPATESLGWDGVHETLPPQTLNGPLRFTEGGLSSEQPLILSRATIAGEGLGLAASGGASLRFETEATEVAGEVSLELEASAGFAGTVAVTGYFGSQVVEQLSLAGVPGQRMVVRLAAPSLTALEIGSAAVLLLRLRYRPRFARITEGWEPLGECEYPICLPVAATAYVCPGRPADRLAAVDLARRRIHRLTYPPPPGLNLGAIDDALTALVTAGPPSKMFEVATPPSAAGGAGASAEGRLLDSLLVAAMHPAVAAALGLYHLDRDVDTETSWDYLLLADHGSPMAPVLGDLQRARDWIDQHPDAFQRFAGADPFPEIDREILFGKRLAPDPAVTPPASVSLFSLAAAPRHGPASTASPSIAGTAGVGWEVSARLAAAHAPVLHHVRRCELGNDEHATAMPAGWAGWHLLTRHAPLVAASPASTSASDAPPPTDWPASPPRYLDSELEEGWYAYRVTGVDLFGRFSAPTTAGPLRLLNRTPPPPPAVEAVLLDPDDPWRVSDRTVEDWRLQHPDVVGLRVAWTWTIEQRATAPDTKEFRIYWQPGRPNARVGRTLAVRELSATESEVATDIPNALGADAWAGAQLWIGNQPFPVVRSGATLMLSLRVSNLGPRFDVRPPIARPCSVLVPAGHPFYVDYRQPARWRSRIYAVGVEEREPKVDLLLSTDHDGRELRGEHATVSGGRATLGLTAGALARLSPWLDHISFDGIAGQPEDGYPIAVVDEARCAVSFDGGPGLAGDLQWKIGRPCWRYLRCLPAPDVAAGEPFAIGVEQPVLYAQVGLTAADGRPYMGDDPGRDGSPWGARPGNESAVGPPATVFRVLRDRPPTPEVWEGAESLRASPPDYYGLSSFSVRWRPRAGYRSHVLRALDRAVIAADRKAGRIGALEHQLSPEAQQRLPSGWRTVAPELDLFYAGDRTDADYLGLSNRALRVLASLPGNEVAFTQITLAPLDADDSALLDRRGPDDGPDYVPDPETWRSWLDTSLPGYGTNRYFYRLLFADGAHNRGMLSAAGPPVRLWGVPPATPKVERIVGGDRRVELRWRCGPAFGGQHDEVWIFRTTNREAARHVDFMERVARVPGAQRSWVDPTSSSPPPPVWQHLFYRLVAVAGQPDVEDGRWEPSAPSDIAVARAFDATPPAAARWGQPTFNAATRVAELRWTLPDPNARALLERRRPEAEVDWRSLTGWLPPGQSSFSDTTREDGVSYEYRLRVRGAGGGSVVTAAMERI